ncbi:MAG: imidazolonepropionase [Anaerolineales bacterium]|nr:imidazolonepropionase [Anaerolineales bacterium]
MRADLLIHSAAELLTLAGGPQRGQELGRLAQISGGAIACCDGRILAVGESAALQAEITAEKDVDASGSVIMPGFVDPHTHALWVGDRANEFELRVAGASYMDIMAAGGGIVASVNAARQATLEQMIAETRPRLKRMLAHGSTTIEVKSGYGLDLETEIRMLDAILNLDTENPWDLVPTFLGAHAIPPEYEGRSDAYTELLCQDILPAVKAFWERKAGSRSLPFVDVFCETGAFSLAESRRILERAKALDFPLKIHADEFDGLGGTALAAELEAVSADHLVCTPDADIAALGNSDTVAVSLPCTPFGLGHADYTPAQKILDANGILAIASDINPGTAWCENMQFVIALACRYLHLTPAQAIAAATINSATALNLEDQIGSLETGKQADILILDIPDHRHLGYRFGSNLVSAVYKRGKRVA